MEVMGHPDLKVVSCLQNRNVGSSKTKTVYLVYLVYHTKKEIAFEKLVELRVIGEETNEPRVENIRVEKCKAGDLVFKLSIGEIDIEDIVTAQIVQYPDPSRLKSRFALVSISLNRLFSSKYHAQSISH